LVSSLSCARSKDSGPKDTNRAHTNSPHPVGSAGCGFPRSSQFSMEPARCAGRWTCGFPCMSSPWLSRVDPQEPASTSPCSETSLRSRRGTCVPGIEHHLLKWNDEHT
jgi:hypothetical protein